MAAAGCCAIVAADRVWPGAGTKVGCWRKLELPVNAAVFIAATCQKDMSVSIVYDRTSRLHAHVF